jgi:hypothetical protein
MINNNSKQNTNPKSPTEENVSTTANKSQNFEATQRRKCINNNSK